MQDQRLKNNSFWNKYKLKKIKQTEKELEFRKSNSPSSIFVHGIFLTIMDILMWGLIAFFIYAWWITRAQPIDCNQCIDAVLNSYGGYYP